MNLKSITKLIPPQMLGKFMKKHMIPSLQGLADMAKKDVDMQEGEADIQLLMVNREGDPERDIPAMNYAIVVALDENLNIVRHVKKYNLDRLMEQFDPKILTQ